LDRSGTHGNRCHSAVGAPFRLSQAGPYQWPLGPGETFFVRDPTIGTFDNSIPTIPSCTYRLSPPSLRCLFHQLRQSVPRPIQLARIPGQTFFVRNPTIGTFDYSNPPALIAYSPLRSGARSINSGSRCLVRVRPDSAGP